MPETQAETQDTTTEEEGIWIDGSPYTSDDLTFREQRKLNELVKKLAEEEGANPDDMLDRIFVPAVITVVKNRTDDSFTLDQALDYRPADLVAPERPTKKAASRKG